MIRLHTNFLFAFMSLLLASGAHASKKLNVNLKPNAETTNFLNSNLNHLESEPDGISKLIYNKNALSELGDKYQNLQKNREMRSHHNLNTFSDELAYDHSSRDMVSTYFRAVLKGHLRNSIRGARMEFRENLERDRREKAREQNHGEVAQACNASDKEIKVEQTSGIKKSADQGLVSVAAKKQQAQANSSAELKLDEVLHSVWMVGENIVERHQSIGLWSEAEARVHYDLPRGTMHVNFLSTIVDGEMKYRLRSEPLPLSGGAGANADQEKMSVSLMKSFPAITMDTGVVYGVNSSTVGANVSKHLTGPLSAQVSRSVSLRELQQNNTTVQLNVGLGF